MTERLGDQGHADKPSRLTKDGLELSIATQQAREKLGELDVTVSIPGFIDLCRLAIAGLSTARSAAVALERYRSALETIRDESFSGFAYDVAVAALTDTPPPWGDGAPRSARTESKDG